MHSLQDTQHQFCQALAIVRTLPDDGPLQPSATEKLRFYGLYKQATQGDCTLSPPPATNKIQYAKWKAWQTMKSLNPVQAQKLYVNLLAKLLLEFIEDHPEHDQYVEFLQYLQLDDLLPDDACIDSENDTESPPAFAPVAIDEPLLKMVTSPSTQSTYSNGYPVTPLMSPVSRHMDPYMIHIQGMMDEFSYMDHSSVQKNLEFSKSPPPSTASVSQYAVQMLQDDVALLAQEIDALRQTIKQRERRRRQLRWTWVRFLKSLVQHAVINSFLAFVIFWCLWRQRSPIAYTIIGYMRPKVKQMLRVIVHSMLH